MEGHEMEAWESLESISWEEIWSIVWSRSERFAYSADDALLSFVDICERLPHKMQSVRTLNLATDQTLEDQPPFTKLGHRGLSALVRIVKAGYFNQLQTLDLSGHDGLSRDIFEALGNLFQSGHWNQLQELRLRASQITTSQVNMLAKYAASGYLSKLVSLNLSCNFLNDKDCSALADSFAAAHLSKLVSLDLSDNHFGAKGTTAITNALASCQCSKMFSLNLSRSRIGDGGATALADAFASGSLPNLQVLNLSFCDITGAGVRALAKSFASGSCTKLNSLDLSGNTVGEAGAKALCTSFESGHLSDLQTLFLRYTKLDDTKFKLDDDTRLKLDDKDKFDDRLADAFKSGRLSEWAWLVSRKETERFSLGYLGKLQRQASLGFRMQNAGVVGAAYLGEAIASGNLSNMRTLALSGNRLQDDEVANLVDSFGGGHLNKMESLDLSDTGMGRKGAINLARWLESGKAKNLHYLNLSKNRIGDVGAEALASSFQSGNLSNLERLYLSDSEIGTRGAEALAHSFKSALLIELRELDLSGNELSQRVGKGIQHGAAALMKSFQSGGWKKLRTFDMSRTGVDDVAVKALAEAIAGGLVSSLQHLRLSGTCIGQSATLSLVQAYGHGEWQRCELRKKRDWTDLRLSRMITRPIPLGYVSGELITSRTLRLPMDLGDSTFGRTMAFPRPSGYISGELIASRMLHDHVDLDESTHLRTLAGTIGEHLQVLHVSVFGTETALALGEPIRAGQWKKLRTLVIQIAAHSPISNESWKALIIAFQSPTVSELEYVRLVDLKKNELDVTIKEIAQVFEAGTLQNLKVIQLFDSAPAANSLSEEIKETLVSCYRKNPYLVVRICAEELESEPGPMGDIGALRRGNEGRVMRLRELEGEPDVAGKHGKVFLCGNPSVGKTTLRISLAKETTNSTVPSTTNSAANSGANSKANSTANSTAYSAANSTVHSRTDAAIDSAADAEFNSATNLTTNFAASKLGQKGRWARRYEQRWMTGRRKKQFPTPEIEMSNAEDGALSGPQTPLSEGRRLRKGNESNMKSLNMPGTSSPTSALLPTRGIEVSNIEGAGSCETQPLVLALWDLAGQHEYQVLHSAFLPDIALASGQATFFVLVCGTDKTVEDSFESAVYWLRYLSSNSVKDVQGGERRRRVFVVLNCFHGDQSDHHEEDWKTFIGQCQSRFGRFLNLHGDPFIFDATDADQVHTLKERLLIEASSLLMKRKMPQICFTIQENCKEWIEGRRGGKGYYPVLTWSEFSSRIGRSCFSNAKLTAAAQYLHEAGHLILFTVKAEASLSTMHLGTEEILLIVDPTWFCQNVIGHLLLPERLVTNAEKFQKMWKDLDLENNPLPISTFEKWQFLVPEEKVPEVVVLMSRLGLCYQLETRSESVFIPALIKSNDAPEWSSDWNKKFDQQTWVMGYSLIVKKPYTTLLPVVVLRKLQVDLAQEECIGRRSDSRYLARKFCIVFTCERMKVLIEYPFHPARGHSTEDRIDVLVKPMDSAPSHYATKRVEQTNFAHMIVNRIISIARECCPGVELQRRVVKPWAVRSGWVSLENRDIGTSVEEVKKRVTDRLADRGRGFGKMNWEEPIVSEEELLPEEDLVEYKHLVLDKYSRTEGAVRRLGLSDFNKQQVIAEAPQNPDSLIIWRAVKGLKEKLDALSRNVNEMRDDVTEIKGNIHKIAAAQESINLHLLNLERLSVENKEVLRTVPRFVYLKETGAGSKWWIKLREKFSKGMTLHFLCESPRRGFHEVEAGSQRGVQFEMFEGWVQKLLPVLDWTLRVTFVALRIAGNVALPGLGLALSDLPADTLSRAIQMACGIPDLWKYISDTFEVGSIAHPIDSYDHSVAENLGKDNSCSSGNDHPHLDGSFELRGKARAAVREIYNNLDYKQKWEQVGLTRVWLDDDHHVVWICNQCLREYGGKAHELQD